MKTSAPPCSERCQHACLHIQEKERTHPNTAVEENLELPSGDGKRVKRHAYERGKVTYLVSNRIDNILQDIEASHSSIDLPARMVAHDDALAPALDRPLGILDVLDALEKKWFSPADLAPLFSNGRNVCPGKGLSVPHLVDPVPACRLGIFGSIDADLRKALDKDGVR